MLCLCVAKAAVWAGLGCRARWAVFASCVSSMHWRRGASTGATSLPMNLARCRRGSRSGPGGCEVPS
eukprot:scaffold1072_cov356-Prasinococcus_capsulatus_cf.AAC.8